MKIIAIILILIGIANFHKVNNLTVDDERFKKLDIPAGINPEFVLGLAKIIGITIGVLELFGGMYIWHVA